MKARERGQIADQLGNHAPTSDPLLIVGTSSFIGECFDCSALATLSLAAPITFKNRLVQYVGRVTRPYPSKSTATVHDYHDENTPAVASSLKKRAPGYPKDHTGAGDALDQLMQESLGQLTAGHARYMCVYTLCGFS